MRLVELAANRKSFKTVRFNPTGLTLIVGAQADKRADPRRSTYNGVGKSLIVALVHFCLGSSDNREFGRKLAGWTFTLMFESLGELHSVARETSNQKAFVLDRREVLSQSEFCSWLEARTFNIPASVPNLTFRSLLPSFIRPNRKAYVAYDGAEPYGSGYQKLVRNAFLLGLDVERAAEKYRLREEKVRVGKLRKDLSEDRVFVEYFTHGGVPEIELRDLEENIVQLASAVADYKVAESYYAQQGIADELKRQAERAKRRKRIIRNALDDIDLSLSAQQDIRADAVIALYADAGITMPSSILKTLAEVQTFHAQLLVNRAEHLAAERIELQRELTELESALAVTHQELDDARRFLGEHGALDDFVRVSNRLSALRARAEKLRDYKGLLAQYGTERERLKVSMSEGSLSTSEYLESRSDLLRDNMDRFREFANRFYGTRGAGLVIKNNEGDNQSRYDIEAHIEGDASDGINEVKIFSYDLTVLTLGHNHRIGLLFHDSRLFANVDPRQRAMMIRLAHEYSTEWRLQYIATLNEDQIETMRDQFTPDEFESVIARSVTLKLTDENDEAKLLGIQVDMNYEKAT